MYIQKYLTPSVLIVVLTCRYKITDEATVLRTHQKEVRWWASVRAQTLARTVDGMMFYELALRLIGKLERLPPEEIENVVKTKFSYVVTCQVYGQMKSTQVRREFLELILSRVVVDEIMRS